MQCRDNYGTFTPECNIPPAILPHHDSVTLLIIEVPPWYDILALEIDYMIPLLTCP